MQFLHVLTAKTLLMRRAARTVFKTDGQEWIGGRLPRGMKKAGGFPPPACAAMSVCGYGSSI
jgi:hypothetical protein